MGLLSLRKTKPANDPVKLMQEGPGFYLGIGTDLTETGRQAATTLKSRYDAWRFIDRHKQDSSFKRQHFTIAVGGGNTVQSVYRALLEANAYDINWLSDVRFFFLDESTGERNWVSASDSIVSSFINPLSTMLVRRYGLEKIQKSLELEQKIDETEVAEHMIEAMLYPVQLDEVTKAVRNNKPELANQLAHMEADRYHRLLRKLLGKSLNLHMIMTGIGRDGGLGAFSPYTPELAEKTPGLAVIEKDHGALRVALNRGVLTRADCVALIIAGNLKLKALGRFEMEDGIDFETTVMETPVRMLRETRKIAEKVYVFADDQALFFKEGVFEYRQNNQLISTKAEIREGNEENGIHIFLLHGFMGLYSYVNLLIRLPSAWTVSALHRGKHAKKLPTKDIFPHYATSLRKAILQNWRNGRPTPVGCHSIAGVISDHLLLSLLKGRKGELPEFEDLKKEDQKLVEALRAGGLIHMACWTPSDTHHIGDNTDTLLDHVRKKSALDYGGPQAVYHTDSDGKLALNNPDEILNNQPGKLLAFAKLPAVEHFINLINRGMRHLLDKQDIQQKFSNREIPYGIRVVGGRLLRKVSFYGLLKEVSASLHDPLEYQARHLQALDIILKYDIPLLIIIHRDDFLVSANRHREEYDYLLKRRLEIEGVKHEKDLQIPCRMLFLERETEELPMDPLNPHLMLMSTSQEGDKLSRQVTAAITRFVNENVYAATCRNKIDPLDSVGKWQREQTGNRQSAPRRRKAG